MRLKVFIIFLVVSILFLFQFFLEPNIIFNNDLNGNIVPLLNFKDSVLKLHGFVLWNPFINQGIPSIADPLYGIFNPIIGITILLLPYQIAIKMMYFISLLLACITMYLLAKLFKISDKTSVLISITYACSSYFTARIVAGHLEKIVSYGFLPLFIFCLIKTTQKKNILWGGLTSITLSLILFSGDIYNALYCIYAVLAVFILFLFKDRKVSLHLLYVLFFFLLFSSIKILPMIELQHYISKIKEPFVGELNLISMSYNLFFPFTFLKNLYLYNYLSVSFNWWESLAFIGPFSILGIYSLIKYFFSKHSLEISILLTLTFILILISIPNSPLNPLHYIISKSSILQYFHVPSRVLAMLGVIILLFFGLLLDQWKNRKIALSILIINFVIVFIFSQHVLKDEKLESINPGYINALNWIKENKGNSYYSVHKMIQGKIPQDKAYQNAVLMLQSNYGLFLKNSLAEKYNFRGESDYVDLKPRFIMSDSDHLIDNDHNVKSFGSITVLENKDAISFATINKNPQKTIFGLNKITVNASSNGKNKLVLLETNYPGWKLFIDGKESNILAGRFLETNTLIGNHTYEFTYFSKYFYFGLITSTLSFLIWLLYVSRRNLRINS